MLSSRRTRNSRVPPRRRRAVPSSYWLRVSRLSPEVPLTKANRSCYGFPGDAAPASSGSFEFLPWPTDRWALRLPGRRITKTIRACQRDAQAGFSRNDAGSATRRPTSATPSQRRELAPHVLCRRRRRPAPAAAPAVPRRDRRLRQRSTLTFAHPLNMITGYFSGLPRHEPRDHRPAPRGTVSLRRVRAIGLRAS